VPSKDSKSSGRRYIFELLGQKYEINNRQNGREMSSSVIGLYFLKVTNQILSIMFGSSQQAIVSVTFIKISAQFLRKMFLQ
jgi:hypothetical protein